jgi:hypothetical protein
MPAIRNRLRKDAFTAHGQPSQAIGQDDAPDRVRDRSGPLIYDRGLHLGQMISFMANLDYGSVKRFGAT